MTYSKWANQASKNAISLAEESRILFNANKKERAYYLSHMASEESSKAILLQTMHLRSTPLSDLPKVERLLRNHKKKIEFVLELAKADNLELAKQLEGTRDNLLNHINNLKNNSMYVTHVDGVIKSPSNAVKNIDIEQFVFVGEALAKYSSDLMGKP